MIYLSYKAKPELIDFLKTLDEVSPAGPIKNVDPRLCGHADLIYCSLNRFGKANAQAAGDELLQSYVFKGDEHRLSSVYPGDCLYNAAVAGRYFIHNEKITDSALLAFAEKHIPDLQYISVKQGYTKCSIAVLDDTHIITSDRGIAKSVQKSGAELKVLVIDPGGIVLEGFKSGSGFESGTGFESGFIGGSCGRAGNYLVFNGDITAHSNYGKIRAFADECSLEIKSFPWPLEDIGSIIQG